MSASNAIVVSVHYRLAPDAKFPAAWDDSLATYKWALANAASLKGDPKKMGLAGESAGGNLAVSTAIAIAFGGPTPHKLYQRLLINQDLHWNFPALRVRKTFDLQFLLHQF